jgi:hypothetical protein
MSSDQEPEASQTNEWSMLDDCGFLLRPGYKFPFTMSYKQLCQLVNKEVRKIGSGPMRPKIRNYIQIHGQKLPRRVTFYCCHGRRNYQKVSRAHTDSINNPSDAKVDLTQEKKSLLFTDCPCCFSIIFEEDFDSLYRWKVAEEDYPVRPLKSCFWHRGHPKRLPAVGHGFSALRNECPIGFWNQQPMWNSQRMWQIPQLGFMLPLHFVNLIPDTC